MKKLIFLLLLLPTILFGQSETNVFTTYDTLLNAGYAGITWRARISRPTNYFTTNHPDTATRAVILTIPGQGEMGTNYGTLDNWGPHWEIGVRSWNRAVPLANGVHYPIFITVISSTTQMSGREAHDVVQRFKTIFHVPQEKFHVAGLSQGAVALTSSVLYESSAGNESGMKLFRGMAAFHWASSEPSVGNDKPVAGWGRWAKQYGGRYFGLEGNGSDNFRNVWRVSNPMNDSLPGSSYFSYTSVGGGGHGGWDTIYSPHQVHWRSVTPYGTYNTPSQGVNGINRMGTYVDGQNIYQWLLMQGDTALAGTGTPVNNPPTANAGIDQSITLPVSSVFVTGSGTDDVGIVSYAWSKVSGPASSSISTPNAQNTTITSLTQGVYVFRLTTTDAGGLTATDDMQVTVNAAGNAAPTANAGTDQTITLPTSSISLTGSGNDDLGVVSYAWTRIAGPNTPTITTPSSQNTTVTGLITGSYTFRLTVTDAGSLTGVDDVVITVNPNPSGAINYTWNSATTNILITPSTFTADLKAGDTVFIPFRSGGYRSYSFTNLDSKTTSGQIVIYFRDSAYITPSASSLAANIITTSKGVSTVNMIMTDHNDMAFRLSGYSQRIFFINSIFKNGAGFSNTYLTTPTAFNGSKDNSFSGWKWINCTFDAQYGTATGGWAIRMGRLTTSGFWFDAEVVGCTFNNYRSDNNDPANMILVDNSWGVKIHGNTFYNLGVVAIPTGHAAVINGAATDVEVYANKFIRNFGNSLRVQAATLPSLGYTNSVRFYNNIVINNRKYSAFEPRPVGAGTKTTLNTNGNFVADGDYEYWFNTVWNSGVGTGASPYNTGGADWYAADKAVVKGNLVAGINDAAWGSTYSPRVLWEAIGTIAIKDTSNNRLVELWVNTGLQDSVTYTPQLNGLLYNTGPTPPSWLTTDYFGNPRVNGISSDIGAVERQFIILVPVIRIKGRKIRYITQ